MADGAARAVLERLLLRLRPPHGEERMPGALLVALVVEGGPGRPRCTTTVAAAGELCCALRTEALWGGDTRVPEQLGAHRTGPRPAAPCCRRLLERAPLRAAFQASPRPGTLLSDCRALRRFLHRASVVHPEVEFHLCVSVDGTVASCTHGQESAWVLAGVRLRVQSRHFARLVAPGGAPPCSRIHPVLGPPIRLHVPPAAAAAGLGGELSIVPAAALCPCLRPCPNLPSRLAAAALFCYDPAGLPAAPHRPQLFQDPSWLADWGRFGCAAAPCTPPAGEEELVTPDATYVVQPAAGAPEGDRHPQTLLLFLFVRHEDPFQAYDAGTRRLLLAHLEQTLLCSRPALARGIQSLVHPMLQELSRRAQSQERLARSLPVARDAVTAVVAGSTSAHFRQRCLRIMQVADTPALAAATWQSLAEVTRCRLLHCASCDPPREEPPDLGDTERGEGQAGASPSSGDICDPPVRGSGPGVPGMCPPLPDPSSSHPSPAEAGSSEGQEEGAAWLREVANLAEWTS